ncbi:MAG: hypothetical protein K6F27_06480 [Ruminococcus sp.]|nr:hypothetical protein [Ruminococcus sp.]
MMLYDVLKASKGLYVDDSFAMIWGKQLGGWAVTTLTGTLPMTFRSNGTALINYKIYGTAEGAGIQTENEFDGNYQAAFINTANNKYSTLTGGRTAVIQCDPNTQYTISVWNGCNRLVVGESETEPQIDDAVNIVASYTTSIPPYVTITTGANVHYIACYVSNQDNTPTISIVKGSTPPENHIPYGYQIPMLVKQRTKNFVDLSSVTDSTSNGVTYTVDSINGTITANRTATSTSNSALTFDMTLPAGTYIFSCGDNPQRDITYDSYLRIPGATIARDNPDDPPGSEFTLEDETTFTTYIRIQASYDAQNLVFRPMIRKDDTTSDFEPYYNIKQADIFIGDSKLAAEDYIDYESGKIVRNGTPTDPPLPLPELETFEGTNTLDSTVEVGEVTITGMIKEAE